MEYKVDNWNNFCRVFEVPLTFPKDYCFDGGHQVTFKMVDWFIPVPNIGQAGVSKKEWLEKVGEIETIIITGNELQRLLVPWLREKPYVRPAYTYLVLCDFGATICFEKEINTDLCRAGKY